jgi:undecaprenyl-diphosphatase
MKNKAKRKISVGLVHVFVFTVFTWLVQVIDVKPVGINGTDVGFSSFNCMIHKLFGVNMALYTITDWAGLVPVFVGFGFAILGLIQLVRRKSLIKVDPDILVLGVYYIIVVSLYVLFESVSINYRPTLINGFMEKSYPSSTTLLVLSVMPTLAEQVNRRCSLSWMKQVVTVITVVFSVLTVLGRLISGVHWFTDIVGSVLISAGLFCVYKGFVVIFNRRD